MAAVMAVAPESVVQGATAPGVDVPAWSPDPATLKQVISLLNDSTSANSAVQGTVYKQLESYALHYDFNNYLAHILARDISDATTFDSDTVIRIRQVAGLLLKNNIRLLYSALSRERQAYINAQLQCASGDEQRQVRASAALCISAVVERCGLVTWPDLTSWLHRALRCDSPNILSGALTVFCRISEDLAHVIEQDTSGSMDVLIPTVIALCGHVDSSNRAMALQIVNHFVVLMPPVMHSYVESYCRALFEIAEDNTVEVRKRVCSAICLLAQSSPSVLEKYMPNIIQYMLQSSRHPDEQVALEAGEFWIIMPHFKNARFHLSKFFPELISMLMDNMVFSQSDRVKYDAANIEDDMVPDRPEDMRPKFHQARLREFAPGTKSPDSEDNAGLSRNGERSSKGVAAPVVSFRLGDGSKVAMNTFNHEIDEQVAQKCSDDESDDDDDINECGDDGEEWSIRKCSANALDKLADIFSDEVLHAVLPKLNNQLTSDQWERRECAVLVLGAIANGCYSGIESQLPHIFPFLMALINDEHYMVRCVTLWTIARYSRWIVHRRDESRFETVLAAFLKSMLDRNKKVQNAACSALAIFEEEAGAGLSPYVQHILQAMVPAFGKFQAKNLIVLYDTICTLADAVGSTLGDSEYLGVLMPMLINKWNSLADTDQAILPLLECLTCVFRAIGAPANNFAPNIVARCVNIIDAVYKLETVHEKQDIHVEFLTCSLDLICGLAEAIGPSIDPLVAKGERPALPLLFIAMGDSRQEVRQSAFALVGEFARARLPALIPALHQYVQRITGALNPEFMSVSNNATWALGEMVMMAGFLPASVPVNREAIKQYLVEALDPLIRVVNMPQLNKSLLENTAISLGRMGLVIPDAMAPRLSSFACACFMALRDIRDDAEKEQAAHGLNALIRMNPPAIYECFVYYVDSIASWYNCKAELEMDFAAILTGFKTSLGDQWFPLFRSFPPALQSLLRDRFKL